MFKLKFLKKVDSDRPLLLSTRVRGTKIMITSPEREEEKMFHLFDIAERYAFDNITKHLIDIIDANEVHIDPVQKLLIGGKNKDLQRWVMPAFVEVVKRPSGLTLDEMKKLGLDRVSEICNAREHHLRSEYFNPSQCPLSQAFYHA
jgi:hypothetical protein